MTAKRRSGEGEPGCEPGRPRGWNRAFLSPIPIAISGERY
jgi:hypothetical protein